MNLLIMGLSHRSAPLDVLEHVAVSCADTDKVLPQLLPREPVTKTLLLSTCNQVEIYAVVATFHHGLAKITDILAHQSAMTPDHLSPHLCVHHAAASIEHLFPVAAETPARPGHQHQDRGRSSRHYAKPQ
ncbi:MAG TPA: hypothetical protein VGO16_13860 [Pseudonocardiaceae bacterium]|jgi:glutamyl-tRNA reductase|nr:hypothetical protein [Pseudonocardiaceae bacterium]